METINQVPRPQVKILYNNKDITQDISESIISVSYKDNAEGHSDTIDIELEDAAGLWRDGWYPDKGADLTVSFGYNNVFLDCGVFEIDKINLKGPPDTVTISAIGAGINGDVRTKVTTAHENKTLRQIVETIAKKHGFTILGEIEDIVVQRKTQYDKTDLTFLKELGKEYGYMFSLRGKQIIFMDVLEIENLEPVQTIDRTDLSDYSIEDKTLQTYSEVTVQSHNPTTKKVSKYTIKLENPFDFGAGRYGIAPEDAKKLYPFFNIKTKDRLNIHTKTEDNKQAERKAVAAIYRANSLQQEGNITVEGNPYLVAGNNFDLTGLGKLSGTYNIMSSSHSISRAGWTVNLDIKRVGFVIKSKTKSTKPKKAPKYDITVVK